MKEGGGGGGGERERSKIFQDDAPRGMAWWMADACAASAAALLGEDTGRPDQDGRPIIRPPTAHPNPDARDGDSARAEEESGGGWGYVLGEGREGGREGSKSYLSSSATEWVVVSLLSPPPPPPSITEFPDTSVLARDVILSKEKEEEK